MSMASVATQRELSPLLLAAPRGWLGRGMRPHLLGWAQVPTQALAWLVALALALTLARVREELAGFRLLLAMSR